MSNPLKLLVCGDVEGKFNQLFNRVKSIQKKAGPFDMLFCVGNFFGDDNSEWERYMEGQVEVPIDTFVLGPNKDEHTKFYPDANGYVLCKGITYLGKKGVYTGSSGLRIAYVSGIDGVNANTSDDNHFSAEDIQSLSESLTASSQFKGVDILLTSAWPRGVAKYGSEIAEFNSMEVGSSAISQLAMVLRPRYHFSGMQGAFYERPPYRNHRVLTDATKHVTRFIGIARLGNSLKKKYLYAFNIVPMKKMDDAELIKQPQDVTECPYKYDPFVKETAKQGKDDGGRQFFYDQQCLDRGSVVAGRGGRGGKRRDNMQDRGPPQKRQSQPAGPCWFCLGSPEVEKHHVVSVGTQTYVCLAKGGLTPHHALITPIGHHQSLTSAPSDVIEEIEKYKAALRKCFKNQGKGVVFFERNYKTSHMQIQVVPVPMHAVDELKHTFLGCALSQDIELSELPEHSDIKQIVQPGRPYFYAELPSGDKLLHQIKKNFPLQFGREAVAHSSILNMPERMDWRECTVEKEQETKLASDFRELFEKYDFNM